VSSRASPSCLAQSRECSAKDICSSLRDWTRENTIASLEPPLVVISREFSKYVSPSNEARAEGAALSAPIGQKEISDRLGRMSNSAPGPDRVEYQHLMNGRGMSRDTRNLQSMSAHAPYSSFMETCHHGPDPQEGGHW